MKWPIVYKGAAFVVVFVLVATLVSTLAFGEALSGKMIARALISGLVVFALLQYLEKKKAG